MMTKRKAKRAVTPIDGAAILNDANTFQPEVLWMADYMHDMLTLTMTVSHIIDSFTTVPRVLALAPEAQAGKTTLLNVVSMLGNNPWEADPTTFALRSKFNEREKPLPIFDEIGDVYGPSGTRTGNKEFNTILKKGYQWTATLSLSVDRAAVDVSCYCMAAMGGLRNAVPNDLYSRCVPFRMNAAPADVAVKLKDSLDPSVIERGKIHGERIHQWARANADKIAWTFRNFKRPHSKMFSRLRQVYGPMYAVALVAGGDWPERFLAAWKIMALDSSDEPVLTAEQRILRDAAALFQATGRDRLFSRDIAQHLLRVPEEKLYKILSNRELALLMTRGLGNATSMTIEGQRGKGFYARKVLVAWQELTEALNLDEDDDEEPDEFEDFFEITDVNKKGFDEGSENDLLAA